MRLLYALHCSGQLVQDEILIADWFVKTKSIIDEFSDHGIICRLVTSVAIHNVSKWNPSASVVEIVDNMLTTATGEESLDSHVGPCNIVFAQELLDRCYSRGPAIAVEVLCMSVWVCIDCSPV